MKWLAGREEQADRYFEEIIEIAKDSSGDYTVHLAGIGCIRNVPD